MQALQQAKVEFTYDDYKLLPDHPRHELIDGDLIMSPAPVTFHQKVSAMLYFLLNQFILKHQLGWLFYAPVDVVLSQYDVVQPDLLFIARDHKSIIKKENIQGAPDLVIEIISPSTAGQDRIVKRKLYAKFGVREYWIVDPEQKSIEVMQWAETGFKTLQVYPNGSQLHSQVLAGFELPLQEVFEEL